MKAQFEDSTKNWLIDFAEGRVDAADWFGWWANNGTELKKALSAGQFLRLKRDSRMPRHDGTTAAHSEVCEILNSIGAVFAPSDRYGGELDAFLSMDEPRSDFFGEAMQIAESEFNANCDEVFLNRLFDDFSKTEPNSDDASTWLRDKLAAEFICFDKRPDWRRSCRVLAAINGDQRVSRNN